MVYKLKQKILAWRFWFCGECIDFCHRMTKKYMGVEGKEKQFNYWINKAKKYCDKEKTILGELYL
jgi:hypothetical protein